MADVYEYCYPFMQPLMKDCSHFQINTSHFSPRDLSLYIESLETISRLEREKHARRVRRKEQKLAAHLAQRQAQQKSLCTTNLDSTTGPSADEAEDEPVLYLESKKITSTPIDENYFSGPESGKSSPCANSLTSSNQMNNVSHEAVNGAASSDSEESGVFAIGGNDCKKQKNTAEIRTRAQVLTKTKQRSKRSRFMGFVLKRESARSKTPSLQELNTPKQDKAALAFELKLNNIIKQQLESLGKPKTLKTDKKSRRHGFVLNADSAEERFLDKALRYLTL